MSLIVHDTSPFKILTTVWILLLYLNALLPALGLTYGGPTGYMVGLVLMAIVFTQVLPALRDRWAIHDLSNQNILLMTLMAGLLAAVVGAQRFRQAGYNANLGAALGLIITVGVYNYEILSGQVLI